MPNRAERRAAERAANKASRKLAAASASAVVAPVPPVRFADTEADHASRPAHLDAAPETEQPLPPVTQLKSSAAQIQANRENSQNSTGPTSALGKQTVSQNRRCHGLIGAFKLNANESAHDYARLVEETHQEYNPQTPTEARLTCSLIQHYWLMQRAIRLQAEVLGDDDRKLALYLRYQTTHERSYYKAQKELKASVKERAKLENGFEQQKQKSDLIEARTRLTHAKAQHLEIDTACRQVMDSPIPGHGRIGFEQLTKACSDAIATVLNQNQQAAAA